MLLTRTDETVEEARAERTRTPLEDISSLPPSPLQVWSSPSGLVFPAEWDGEKKAAGGSLSLLPTQAVRHGSAFLEGNQSLESIPSIREEEKNKEAMAHGLGEAKDDNNEEKKEEGGEKKMKKSERRVGAEGSRLWDVSKTLPGDKTEECRGGEVVEEAKDPPLPPLPTTQTDVSLPRSPSTEKKDDNTTRNEKESGGSSSHAASLAVVASASPASFHSPATEGILKKTSARPHAWSSSSFPTSFSSPSCSFSSSPQSPALFFSSAPPPPPPHPLDDPLPLLLPSRVPFPLLPERSGEPGEEAAWEGGGPPVLLPSSSSSSWMAPIPHASPPHFPSDPTAPSAFPLGPLPPPPPTLATSPTLSPCGAPLPRYPPRHALQAAVVAPFADTPLTCSSSCSSVGSATARRQHRWPFTTTTRVEVKAEDGIFFTFRLQVMPTPASFWRSAESDWIREGETFQDTGREEEEEAKGEEGTHHHPPPPLPHKEAEKNEAEAIQRARRERQKSRSVSLPDVEKSKDENGEDALDAALFLVLPEGGESSRGGDGWGGSGVRSTLLPAGGTRTFCYSFTGTVPTTTTTQASGVFSRVPAMDGPLSAPGGGKDVDTEEEEEAAWRHRSARSSGGSGEGAAHQKVEAGRRRMGGGASRPRPSSASASSSFALDPPPPPPLPSLPGSETKKGMRRKERPPPSPQKPYQRMSFGGAIQTEVFRCRDECGQAMLWEGHIRTAMGEDERDETRSS